MYVHISTMYHKEKTSLLSNVTVSALRTAITRTTKRPFSFHAVGFQLLSPIIKSCAFTK